MYVDRWTDKDVVYTYNGMLLSHKKNEIMPFAATWMNLQIMILSKVAETNSVILCQLYVESKKKWYEWTHL